jgi:hypothetical protein
MKPTDRPQLAELVVSAERHRHMEDLLSYVSGIHHSIDPDMYRISKEQLEHFAWCFEAEAFEHTGFAMTVSWEDLFALEIIVDAAYTYSKRRSSPGRVEGLTDQGFEDLLNWLARAEDELFRSKPQPHERTQ